MVGFVLVYLGLVLLGHQCPIPIDPNIHTKNSYKQNFIP